MKRFATYVRDVLDPKIWNQRTPISNTTLLKNEAENCMWRRQRFKDHGDCMNDLTIYSKRFSLPSRMDTQDFLQYELPGTFRNQVIHIWRSAVGFYKSRRTYEKGQRHYLEINQDWVVHYGFQKWRFKKRDLLYVETGHKGWTEDYAPYLKIYTQDRQYYVDDGFLINEQRAEELARAIRGTSF